MQSIEITGKSLDEVRRQGAEKLGVDEGQVQVTVLEETKGLFGKSQIRAKVEAKPEKTAPAKKAPAKKEKPAPEPAPVAEVKAEEKKPRRGKKEATPEPAVAVVASEEGETTAVASAADADIFVGLLSGLVSESGLQVNVNSSGYNGRYVNISLDGRDAAFLVGKHGEVLNSLQYLLNIMSSRKVSPGVKATLDANDYRRRREEALTKLASKIAEQVLARQEEAVLDALPAFERRIVHKALSTISGIETYSEGEEPNRRVVIAPAA